MLKSILFFSFLSVSISLKAQQTKSEDTLQAGSLRDVVLKAFEQNKRLTDVPAAVNYINSEKLNRYNNTSILNALNATAGIRMEERSPGSYRLSIRGSSLRAPFGVRNVKIYYNDIPFTDPGGNTYLNQLGFYNFGSIEIIKGPGASLYGAGTGGVMLIQSNNISKPRGVTLSHTLGSFGLENSDININTGNDTFRSVINYQHQSADGYRQQSKMRRDIFSWEVNGRVNETDRITGTFLYGDLYYQTPGALTLAEYTADPKAARPAAGISPSAKDAHAAIFQKTFLAGITYQQNISSAWQNTSTIYGAFSRLDNPAIRNYARNNQPHFGGRTIFQYRKTKGNSVVTWHTGAELQQSYTVAKTYRNKNGNTDSLQTDDEININSYFIFSQLSYEIKSWILTAGFSFNRSQLHFTRLSIVPSNNYTIHFSNQLAPRVAVLHRLNKNISAYASWSRGFSPPTAEEVFPTGSLSNPNLTAEHGISYEVGAKGYTINNRLSFDVNAFYYTLQNAIVQRRDAAGGDFYTNAGSTRQKGIETQVNFQVLTDNNRAGFLNIWLSHTWYNFHYKDFKQVANDFSGMRLPGVAKQQVTAGIDLHSALGFYANIIYQYSDPVPLNDANTAYAGSYNLLSSRVGYRRAFSKINIDLYAGGDNLTNVTYSLGNDLNAFGGRYYNAAPGRNFYGGITIGYTH